MTACRAGAYTEDEKVHAKAMAAVLISVEAQTSDQVMLLTNDTRIDNLFLQLPVRRVLRIVFPVLNLCQLHRLRPIGSRCTHKAGSISEGGSSFGVLEHGHAIRSSLVRIDTGQGRHAPGLSPAFPAYLLFAHVGKGRHTAIDRLTPVRV